MIMVQEVQKVILSTNLQDANISEWDENTTYAKNASVSELDYIYISLADENKGNRPSMVALKWALVGIKNTKAIWDQKYIHLSSYAAEKIEIVAECSGADILVFGGLEAVDIDIEQERNGEIFKTYHTATARWLGDAFREYVFEPVDKKDKAIIPLTPLLSQKLTIKINAPGGIAKCSYLIIGKKTDIGQTLPEGETGIVDFSKKDRTSEGIVYLRQGKVVDDGSYTILIKNQEFDLIKKKIKERIGKPTVFIPTCKVATIVYGFIKDFRMKLINQTSHTYTLDIEEI